MTQIENGIRIASALAAVMLVVAGWRALRRFELPGPMVSFVRAFYGVLWPAPLLAIAVLVALVVRARWRLGFWPYPGHFDPDLGVGLEAWVASPLDPKVMPFHHGVAWIGLAVGAFALLWAIPAYSLLLSMGRHPHRATLSALVAGWVTLVLGAVCDPGGLFSWFLD